MKQLIVGVVFLWSLFPAPSAAQRGGGGHGGGFGGGGFHGGGFPGGGLVGGGFHGGGFMGPGFHGFGAFRNSYFGLPTVGPIPPLGSIGAYNRFGNYGYGWGGGYPEAFDGYGDAGYYDGGYQGPMIVMPEESYGPTVIQPPPPPVRPELHEYKWPESGSDPSAAFAIISKDGSVHSAVAVWVQGDAVRYVTPDGTGGRLALDSVNRAATRSANAAKHLTLSLPAPSSRRR